MVARKRSLSYIGDRWLAQTAKQERDKISKKNYGICGKHVPGVMSAQMLEVSLLGVGTAVIRLESDERPMVK